MGVEIGFDGYLESVVANCHESLRLYTLMDDCEQSQPDFFELKMQVVQPQPENKKRSEQETDKDKNAEPLPENKKRSEQEADKDKNTKPPIPVLEIYKYAQDHVLLMGKAGSGKSTALQKLLLNKAQEAQRNSEALIPVLVKLRSWQSFPSVVALIQDVLETGIQRRLDEETIIDLLFSGRLLLLIDGVNELPSYFQDRNPSHDVEAFRKKYRKTSMIFTTRVLGVSRNLGIAKQMEMLPLSDREMRQFIERCLPQQSEQMLNRLGDRLSRLGETPLLLSMLCDISRQREDGLPANLGSPFKAFADSYDRKIQGDIPVDDKYKRWLPDLLPQIAFAIMPQNDPDGLRLEIPKFEAEDILAKFLDAEKFDKPRDHAKQWLENLLKYHLIQIKTDQIIEFRHQLIQEYYAAEYLRMRLECLTDEKLQKSYLNYLDWTESLTLMLDCEDREEQAVRLVRLALAVDLRLVARLAGAVKYEFQEKTIGLLLREIEEQKTPKLYAIELLGEARSDIAIKSLIQSLTDSDYYVYRFAVVALGKIGSDKAVEPLIQILYNQDYYGLGEVVEVLGGIGSDKAVESLIQILNDPDSDIRTNAAEALGRIGSDKAVEPLIQILNDPDSDIRTNAAEALGRIGSDKAVEPLIQTLNDPDSDIRTNAAEALGRIGSDKAVEPLIQTLNDPDSDIRTNAAEALKKIVIHESVEPLIYTFYKKDDEERRYAAEALGGIVSNTIAKLLIQMLMFIDQDFDASIISSIHWHAAEALRSLSDDKAVVPLVQSIDDPDPNIRRYAAFTLVHAG